jgi:hypothetical protein
LWIVSTLFLSAKFSHFKPYESTEWK